MAVIDFPNSPAVNDTFTAGQVSYKWNGTAWVSNNITNVDWVNVANKPTTFAPAAHTHAISDVTGLQTALDAKANAASSILTKSEAYTLVASDRNTLIQASGTFTITVPADTIAVGTRVDVVNVNDGVITFAGSGLTISSKASRVTLNTQFSAATLFFTSGTTALLVGDLA
jgi:hypothetical protein